MPPQTADTTKLNIVSKNFGEQGQQILLAELMVVLPFAIGSDFLDFIPIVGTLITNMCAGALWLWSHMRGQRSIGGKKLHANAVWGGTIVGNFIPIIGDFFVFNSVAVILMYVFSKRRQN